MNSLFSVVDCCLYVCKNFIASVAYDIYNYILYRRTVLKSVVYRHSVHIL